MNPDEQPIEHFNCRCDVGHVAPDWDNIAAENTRRAVANLPESEIARFIAGCEMLTREAAEEWS